MCETPSVYSESFPVARKPHKCCECLGIISPGERYGIFNGCWDGQWRMYKTCPQCAELRQEIYAANNDREPIALGYISEQIFEQYHPRPDWITRYMENRRKRNAPESRWMDEAERNLTQTK